MNFYPFHIGDYTSATQHLTLEEDCMYRRLLDICYTTEKPLPKDQRQLFRLTRASTELHREAVLTVIGEFFDEIAEGYVSRRADAEIEVLKERQEKARDKANKRWHMPDKERSIAAALPQHKNTYAAAQKSDADGMLPVPVPVPVPNIKNTSAVAQPDGVSISVWQDFCQHRKSKSAKVTQTAIDGIRREADRAGWGLEDALRECCSRGWTGFKADWVAEKTQATETAYQRSMREKYEQIAPSIAAKAPRTQNPNQFFDTLPTVKPLEITNV